MSLRDRVRGSSGLLSGLRRYPKRGWVAGVCAGLADYFDWNVKVLRVCFLLGLIFSGFFPFGLIYIALWYVMEPADPAARVDDGEPHDYHAYQERRQERRWQRAEAYAGASTTDVKTRFSHLEQRLRSMEECVSSRDFELRRELKKLES
jgi:phage shock protein C